MNVGKQKDEAPAEATAVAEKKEVNRGGYIVLGQLEDGNWMVLGTSMATTDKKAITPHAAKAIENGDDFKAFVAVPNRSWHPRRPKPKTDPQFSWT